MKEFFKKNYKIIILSLIFLATTIYSSFNTFIINDDLPYSFFYRGEERITTIRQIILNQKSDYLTINGRFILHCIVQFLLMFDKKLWSILNPLVIFITFIFLLDIIRKYIKNDDKSIILSIIMSLFLSIVSLKYLNYWVAGSVNYTWTFLVITFTMWLYTKTNLNKYFILNFILFGILGALHEMSLVFGIIFLLGTIVYQYLNERKIDFKKIIYFIPMLIAGYYLIKAPGNAIRMQEYVDWYNKNFFEKIFVSIPELSKSCINLRDIYNIVPLVYSISLIYKCIIKNKKIYKNIGYLLIVLIIGTLILNNGWLYFVLAISLFFAQAFINYKENKNELTIMLLACYAMAYSMIITPIYTSIRTNYGLYIMYILLTIYNLDTILSNIKYRKIIRNIVYVFFSIMITIEFIAFTYIGNVHRHRLNTIENVRKNNLKVLELEKIEAPFDEYHPDANCPDNEYWARRYFLNYYKLPKDIVIK